MYIFTNKKLGVILLFTYTFLFVIQQILFTKIRKNNLHNSSTFLSEQNFLPVLFIRRMHFLYSVRNLKNWIIFLSFLDVKLNTFYLIIYLLLFYNILLWYTHWWSFAIVFWFIHISFSFYKNCCGCFCLS